MGAKIIIVEDEAIVAMEYKSSLIKQGYKVVAAVSSAHLALIAFEEHKPDLFLIDIKLKGDKDGIELAREIRKTAQTPILFITGNTDPATLLRLGKISNSSHMGKPILNKELFAEILSLLVRN